MTPHMVKITTIYDESIIKLDSNRYIDYISIHICCHTVMKRNYMLIPKKKTRMKSKYYYILTQAKLIL